MSALSELFSNIAAAIREKNGETGTMKPAEFPDKISAIEVGEGFSSEWLCAQGEFTASANYMTIEHNLGVIPDMIFVYASDVTADNSMLQFASGFSEQFYSAFPSGVYPGVLAQGGAINRHAIRVTATSTIFGHIRLADETTFTVGAESDAFTLQSGLQYGWCAIGGMFG